MPDGGAKKPHRPRRAPLEPEQQVFEASAPAFSYSVRAGQAGFARTVPDRNDGLRLSVGLTMGRARTPPERQRPSAPTGPSRDSNSPSRTGPPRSPPPPCQAASPAAAPLRGGEWLQAAGSCWRSHTTWCATRTGLPGPFAACGPRCKAVRPGEEAAQERGSSSVVANATPVVENGQLVGDMPVRTRPSRPRIEETEALCARMRSGAEAGHRALALDRGRPVRSGRRVRLRSQTRLTHGRRLGAPGLVLAFAAQALGRATAAMKPAIRATAFALTVAWAVAIAACMRRMLTSPLQPSAVPFANRMAAGKPPRPWRNSPTRSSGAPAAPAKRGCIPPGGPGGKRGPWSHGQGRHHPGSDPPVVRSHR